MDLSENDFFFMGQALIQAQYAFDQEEVPVGAVLVFKNQIISKAHNQVEKLKDATAHAEMLCITGANHFLQSKYLQEATVYVSLEPCLMCTGALFWSKIGRIVYGAADPKRGCCNKNFLHPQTLLTGGVLEQESLVLMKKFFVQKRK